MAWDRVARVVRAVVMTVSLKAVRARVWPMAEPDRAEERAIAITAGVTARAGAMAMDAVVNCMAGVDVMVMARKHVAIMTTTRITATAAVVMVTVAVLRATKKIIQVTATVVVEVARITVMAVVEATATVTAKVAPVMVTDAARVRDRIRTVHATVTAVAAGAGRELLDREEASSAIC